MIGEFWEAVLEIINGTVNAILGALNGVTAVFYVDEEGFTIIGQLLLIGLGVGLVMFAFKFIRSLIRR